MRNSGEEGKCSGAGVQWSTNKILIYGLVICAGKMMLTEGNIYILEHQAGFMQDLERSTRAEAIYLEATGTHRKILVMR